MNCPHQAADTAGTVSRAEAFCIAGLLVAFFLKSLVVGQAFFDRWDYPDEIHHFAYVYELSHGRGLPELDVTLIADEVWSDLETDAPPALLRAAQHPPLYYALMTAPYWLGRLAGDDLSASLRAMRGASTLLMTCGMALLWAALRRAGGSAGLAFGAAGMCAGLPAMTYLAGGVNNDHLTFLLASGALFGWVQYLGGGARRGLWWFGVCVGLGCITKTTFVPAFAVAGVVLFLLVSRSTDGFFRRGLPLAVLSLGPLLVWIGRNLAVHGDPIPLVTNPSHTPIDALTLGRFLHDFDVLGTVYHHLVALIGVFPDRTPGSSMLRADGATTAPVTVVAFVSGLATFAAIARRLVDVHIARGAGFVVAGGVVAVYVANAGWLADGRDALAWTLGILFALPVAVPFLLVPDTVRAGEKTLAVPERIGAERIIVAGSLLSVAVYCALWGAQMYDLTAQQGELRGAQGRYLFPLAGFFVIGFLLPGWRALPASARLAPLAAALFWVNDAAFWFGPGLRFLSDR